MTTQTARSSKFQVALLALTLGSATGCATTVPLQGSDKIPAAGGKIEIKTGDNGNTLLTVEVQHLAPPERVTADAKTYVVWVRPFDEGAAATNVGALVLDSELTGKLDTVTPFRAFDLFLTAEGEARAQAPSEPQLLSARVVRQK